VGAFLVLLDCLAAASALSFIKDSCVSPINRSKVTHNLQDSSLRNIIIIAPLVAALTEIATLHL
jgi:hypothetical protein